MKVILLLTGIIGFFMSVPTVRGWPKWADLFLAACSGANIILGFFL